MGDVTQLDATRPTFVKEMERTHPGMSQGQANTNGGTIYRFVHEMKNGDRVVTYDTGSRSYLCGKIIGDVIFQANATFDEENIIRKVLWTHQKDRDSLSTGARNSLGSILTMFKISQDHCQELWNSDATITESDVDDDDHPDPVMEIDLSEIGIEALEEASALAIQDQIARLSWSQAERLVAGLLRALGYKTRLTGRGSDRSADIVATPDGFGFEEPKIIAEVKHRKGKTGADGIRTFLGGRQRHEKGLYVSTGGFSKDAYYEAERANIPIELIDSDRLVDWIVEAHPKFDEETRSLLHLRTVPWPVES